MALMNTRISRRLLPISLLAFISVAALPAAAQQQPQTQPEKNETTQVKKDKDKETVKPASEEIVVTARKREENVEKVPIAVSVVTADKLEQAATADISELQTQVPDLAVYQGRNQSTTLTVFMRGIGQADPLWGVDPGVGLYLDDVYIARPQGALLDVYDVERIEVLRGPQGTLYGKNTIGGAIKYVSRALTDKTTGSNSISPGTQSNRDVRLSFAGALVPGKVRGKIAFASLQHDGYGTNLLTGKDVSNRNTLAGHGALEWLATDKVSVLFGADYTKDEAQPKGYQRLAANSFCGLFKITCAPLSSRFDTQSGLAPLNGTTAHGFSAVVTAKLTPDWNFKSISADRRSNSKNNIDFDTTPARIADVGATYYDKQFSQEFQFLYSGKSKLSGVLGAYYFDGEAGGLVKNIFLNAIFGTTNGKTLTKSIAIFGDGSYALDDKWTLNFGLRGTQEKKNGIAFNAGYTNDTFTTVSAVTANFDKTTTFNSVAPKLGVDYKFSDQIMGYLSLSRGFKSGGYNVRAQATVFPKSADPFKDEVLDVAEVGLKSVLNDGHLVINTAVFDGKYKDIQVSTFTAYDSNGDGVEDAFFGNFLNAGSATMKGAEVEFDASSPTMPWFGANGYASYLDLTPDQFLDANHDGFVDTQVITNAPHWTTGLHFNFTSPMRSGLLTASVGGAYRGFSVLTNEGGSFAGKALLPITQKAYTLYDASVNWLSPDAKWRLGLNGKNLTNKGYLTNGYNIPALGILTGSYGAPRTVLATVEYRFF
jgi:iron complex outermembrane receptor protein